MCLGSPSIPAPPPPPPLPPLPMQIQGTRIDRAAQRRRSSLANSPGQNRTIIADSLASTATGTDTLGGS